jgi:HlyD family secretion protein
LLIGPLVLLAGCDWPWGDTADDGVIRLAGTLEADEVDLSFQVSGRIAELRVDEGARVALGDLIAALDALDYQLALQRAEAEAKATAATLAALEAGTRVQELRVAEATVDQARSRVEFARAEIRRVSELIPRKLASQQQLDQAHLQLEVAVADLAQAEQRLQLLREGPRREDIDKAAAELAARRQAVALARLQLDYTTLESPVAGTVSVRLAKAGEVVSVGRPIVRVAVLATPWVRAYLNETDLARVKLGQKALVQVDGLPNQVFQGRLSFISPVAEFTPKTVETRELRVDLVYRIKVAVDNPEGLLKIGMPADVVLAAATP